MSQDRARKCPQSRKGMDKCKYTKETAHFQQEQTESLHPIFSAKKMVKSSPSSIFLCATSECSTAPSGINTQPYEECKNNNPISEKLVAKHEPGVILAHTGDSLQKIQESSTSCSNLDTVTTLENNSFCDNNYCNIIQEDETKEAKDVKECSQTDEMETSRSEQKHSKITPAKDNVKNDNVEKKLIKFYTFTDFRDAKIHIKSCKLEHNSFLKFSSSRKRLPLEEIIKSNTQPSVQLDTGENLAVSVYPLCKNFRRQSFDLNDDKLGEEPANKASRSLSIQSLRSLFGSAQDRQQQNLERSGLQKSNQPHNIRKHTSIAIQRLQEELCKKMQNDGSNICSTNVHKKCASDENAENDSKKCAFIGECSLVSAENLQMQAKPYRQWHRVSRVITAESKFIISPKLAAKKISSIRTNILSSELQKEPLIPEEESSNLNAPSYSENPREYSTTTPVTSSIQTEELFRGEGELELVCEINNPKANALPLTISKTLYEHTDSYKYLSDSEVTGRAFFAYKTEEVELKNDTFKNLETMESVRKEHEWEHIFQHESEISVDTGMNPGRKTPVKSESDWQSFTNQPVIKSKFTSRIPIQLDLVNFATQSPADSESRKFAKQLNAQPECQMCAKRSVIRSERQCLPKQLAIKSELQNFQKQLGLYNTNIFNNQLSVGTFRQEPEFRYFKKLQAKLKNSTFNNIEKIEVVKTDENWSNTMKKQSQISTNTFNYTERGIPQMRDLDRDSIVTHGKTDQVSPSVTKGHSVRKPGAYSVAPKKPYHSLFDEASISDDESFESDVISNDAFDRVVSLSSISEASQVTGPPLRKQIFENMEEVHTKKSAGPKLRTAIRSRALCKSSVQLFDSVTAFPGTEGKTVICKHPIQISSSSQFNHTSQKNSTDKRHEKVLRHRVLTDSNVVERRSSIKRDQELLGCVNRNWSSGNAIGGKSPERHVMPATKARKVFLAEVASKLLQRVNRGSHGVTRQSQPIEKYLKVQATQDFHGSLPGQLSFRKGQIIKQKSVIRGPTNGMSYGYYRVGRFRKKRKGLFPSNFVTADVVQGMDESDIDSITTTTTNSAI